MITEANYETVYRARCQSCGAAGPMALTRAEAERRAVVRGFDANTGRCAECERLKKPGRDNKGKFIKLAKKTVG
jgi:hypothetical protein